MRGRSAIIYYPHRKRQTLSDFHCSIWKEATQSTYSNRFGGEEEEKTGDCYSHYSLFIVNRINRITVFANQQG